MAQIIYRVSGEDGNGKRVSRTFRNTDDGRVASRAFGDSLESTRTVYDVRSRIGGRVVTRPSSDEGMPMPTQQQPKSTSSGE